MYCFITVRTKRSSSNFSVKEKKNWLRLEKTWKRMKPSKKNNKKAIKQFKTV